MPILVPGNNSSTLKYALKHGTKAVRGFTLLELMVVIAIIALGSAGVVIALPEPSQTALERDAQRMVALFDSARAQSRASGLGIYWQITEDGFKFEGLPQVKNKNTDNYEDLVPYPTKWLDSATHSSTNSIILLGPEPIIARQHVVLQNNGRSLTISTDGLRPFAVELNESENP